MGFVRFRFFCHALEKFCTFLKNYGADFQNNGTKKKLAFKIFCASSCFQTLLVSLHFTTRSTAFENFSRGIFGLFVLIFFSFSQILNAQS